MELNIQPTTDDDYILGILSTIWFVVSRALSEDKSLHKRLVDEDRFRKNVYKMGVGSFINLLRDMARRRSWEELLENGIHSLRLISSTLIVPCFQRCF
jgi:hypothetical protein